MPKPLAIARQSAHPRGILGHVVARVMSLETWALNRRVLSALEPKPGERILELGCGHGRALRPLARAVGPGEVVGVDPSAVMLRIARRRLRREIGAGRVRIEAGDASAIPEPSHSFDKLFSVHTLYFWPDLDAGLREIHRVLRPGGVFLLAFHTRENASKLEELPDSVYTLHATADVEAALRRAGFREVSTQVDPSSGIRLARATASDAGSAG